MIRRAWQAWVELLDRREPPTALALVRIAAAFVLLCDQLWVWHLGLADPLWSAFPAGYAIEGAGWAAPLGLDGHALGAIATVSLALVVLGAGTRIAARYSCWCRRSMPPSRPMARARSTC